MDLHPTPLMFRDQPVVSLVSLLLIVVPLSGCVEDTTPENSAGEARDETPSRPDPLPTVITTLSADEEDPFTPWPTAEDDPFGPEGSPEEPTPSPTAQDSPDPTTPSPTPTQTTQPTPTPSDTEEPSPSDTEAPSPTTTATTPSPTPTATTPAAGPSWPQDGSFVIYRTTSGGGSPGGEYRSSTESTIRIEHQDGTWSGTCSWQRSERFETYDDTQGDYVYEWNNTTGSQTVAFAPARASPDVGLGDTLDVPVILGCDATTMEELTVEDQAPHSAPREDDGSPTWYGYWEPEHPAYKYAYWETDGGLLVAWRDQRHYSYQDGWMVDTDAPLP